MSDLTDFLLARIAEDEAEALKTEEKNRGDLGLWSLEGEGSTDCLVTAARVLAECDAKRRIVDEARILELVGTGFPDEAGPESASRILRLLTLSYADHPDYRDEWRPEPDQPGRHAP